MVKSNDPRLTRKYKSVRLQVLARDEWTCRYCQQEATTVDHVIPIIKGGDPISMDNMVAACRSCNSAKGSRSEGLFLQRQSTPPVFTAVSLPDTVGTIPESPFDDLDAPDCV